MISTCDGTTMAATTGAKSQRLPRKSVREKPYAAREHSTSTPAVTDTDTRVLLRNQRRRPLLPNAAVHASPVTRLANHPGGIALVPSSGFTDVDSAHSSGTSHSTAISSASAVRMTPPTV